MKEQKTNAMRILDASKIKYNTYYYDVEVEDDNSLGMHIAQVLNEPMEILFKTLVTVGQSKNYYVFVIPVAMNLDLKKAAMSVNEKNVQMVHVKDINQITGYVRGGCSPIGMKKQYVTVFDESIELYDKVILSGGKIGVQIELSPTDLIKVTSAKLWDLTK